MNPGAQTIIESLQPYHQGATFTEHPLWQLYELARVGRHRFLHPAVVVFEGFGVRVAGQLRASKSTNVASNPFGTGAIHSFAGVIEGRTLIARFPVEPIDPDRDVYVDVVTPTDIAFARGTPLVEGKPMVGVLSGIYHHIVHVVLPPLRPFL